MAGLVAVGAGWGAIAPDAMANPPRPVSSESEAAESRLCPAELGEQIEAIATRPEFRRARWGILVQTLASPTEAETLYANNAEQYFIPASNVKLLTTAAAIAQWGSAFQIRTSVYLENANPDSAQLRIVGRGDPSLTTAQLQNLVQQVRDRGIRQIALLTADDSYFQGDPIHPNWEWEDVQAGYGTAVNSLILNRNERRVRLYPQAVGQPLRVEWVDAADTAHWQIDNQSVTVAPTEPEFISVGQAVNRSILRVRGQLRVGAEPDESAISVPDPSRTFLDAMRQALIISGIPVQEARVSSRPAEITGQEIAAIASPPLAELLVTTNQDSENIYAESLLRQLGAMAPADAYTSSLQAGLSQVETLLASLGVDPAGFVLADGSGLSRHNLVSPMALVQTLQAMAVHLDAAVYRHSLAIAGVSGTLRNRFQNTPVEGRLYGKTGGLTGVSSLSGYLTPPHYTPLAVSIIISHSDQSGSVRRGAIDDMILQLARLQSCA